eukprot:9374021-Pyramimonas_sp.AAC.1
MPSHLPAPTPPCPRLVTMPAGLGASAHPWTVPWFAGSGLCYVVFPLRQLQLSSASPPATALFSTAQLSAGVGAFPRRPPP